MFVSRRQIRWAFATRQPFARRWARMGVSGLPETKHGSHNQASHGRRGPGARAAIGAYRSARAGGASIAEARAQSHDVMETYRAKQRLANIERQLSGDVSSGQRRSLEAEQTRLMGDVAHRAQRTPAAAGVETPQATVRGRQGGKAPPVNNLPPIPPMTPGARTTPQEYQQVQAAINARLVSPNYPPLPPISNAVSDKQRQFAASTRDRALRDAAAFREQFVRGSVQQGNQNTDRELAVIDAAIGSLRQQTDTRYWLDTARATTTRNLLRAFMPPPYGPETKADPANTGTPGKRTPQERARLAALARWGKYKAKGKGKPPIDDMQARMDAATNRQAALTEAIGAEALDAMQRLAGGQELDAAALETLRQNGLVDDQGRLNRIARQLYNAAGRGDADAISEAMGKLKPDTPADDADAIEDAMGKLKPGEKPKEEKPKGGGGGGGGGKGKEKEAKPDKNQEKRQTAAATAERMGLTADDATALYEARDNGSADSPRMQALGLLDSDGVPTAEGSRALRALEQGDAGAFRQAVRSAVDKRMRAAEAAPSDDAPKRTTRSSRRREDGTVITVRETKDWYKHGSHNQASHGRRTARRRASIAAYRSARSGGASVEEARAKAKEAGLAKQGERDQRLERMRDASQVNAYRQNDAEISRLSSRLREIDKQQGDLSYELYRLQPKYRKQREAQIAALETESQRLRNERQRLTDESQAAYQRATQSGASDRTVLREIEQRAARGETRAGDDVEARMIRERMGMQPPVQPRDRQPVVRDKAKARAAMDSMLALDKEARRRRMQANIAERDASRVESTNPELARQLRLSAEDNRARAREIDTHPDHVRLIAEMNAAGYTRNNDRMVPYGGKAMLDGLKYSRRHSASDEAAMQRGMTHLKAARAAFVEAGAPDSDGDGEPDMLDAETKALDLHTQYLMVCEAVCDAVEEITGEDDEDEEHEIDVYDDHAVLTLEGESYLINYAIVNGDVQLADADAWERVEWDVEPIDGAPSFAEASDQDEEDDQPVMAMVGDAVKMYADGRVAGYAVRFGDDSEPDISPMRDYFTKSTDFWLKQWDKRPMLYHHAQDPATADAPVVGAWLKATIDDVGVWLEGQLDQAHRYYGAIKELINRGALKLSSDSAPHLVRRVRHGDAHEVTRWPLLAASLTPTPAEPRLLPVSALKSAFVQAGLLPPAELLESPEAEPESVARDADGIKATAVNAAAIELELIEIMMLEAA